MGTPDSGLDSEVSSTSRQIGKAGLIRILDELDARDGMFTICVSAETLAEREDRHLLPESEPLRSLVSNALSDSSSDTGIVVFATSERTVAVEPPLPISLDFRAERVDTSPLRALLASEPLIGIVLLRLERYAVCVLKGERLLATKTDSRYMKSRHRAGGQSQRRFERSRERLIRELYDKTCEVARSVFAPYLSQMDCVMFGGERGTLDGFAKRCRLARDLKPKTLSRRLTVDRPNRRALERMPYEAWRSRVTILHHRAV